MPQKLCVKEIQLYERDVKLRLPFRFGMVTLTEAPQAFIRCRIQLADGREGWGMAAELLAPKWFDKNPNLTNEDNFKQLRSALDLYKSALLQNGMQTAFGHYASLYKEHLKAGADAGLNSITASYGPALIDRAIMDALCRIEGLSFAKAMQGDLAGMKPELLLPEFSDFDMPRFLSSLHPSSELHARHTVGMVDPLDDNDHPPSDHINDGLPETLEQVINTYGVTYFKIKVGGDLAQDIERLKKVAQVLDKSPDAYKATLDGNEQYDNIDGVIELLSAMKGEPSLKRLMGSLLFVEQPIQRSQALKRNVSALAQQFPVIIDESDDSLAAFPLAREKGYGGVSSKSCKGFYKSLINLARCKMWSEQDGTPYIMSAEDLTLQAGVAVQQDLTLVAYLGLGHLERNGHHYVNGMAGASEQEQSRFINAHPDLYHRANGRVSTHITDGKLSIGSLQCAGYGTAVEPDWEAMQMMATGN